MFLEPGFLFLSKSICELLFWSLLRSGLCSLPSPIQLLVCSVCLVDVGLQTEMSVLGIDLKQTACVLIFCKELEGEGGVFCILFPELKCNGPLNGAAFLFL